MYEKYFNKLREECLIRNRSSRTADTYINNIHHFMKWTGYTSMEDLSLQDARSFILEKRNSGLSSATCNFYNSSICFCVNHTVSNSGLNSTSRFISPSVNKTISFFKNITTYYIKCFVREINFFRRPDIHHTNSSRFS